MNPPLDPSGEPALILGCPAGLCNRLRVLVSGLVLAEAAGRSFRMLWPVTEECGAQFHHLFSTPWPVEETTLEEMRSRITGPDGPVENVLAFAAPEVALVAYHWLIFPYQYPAHRALLARCEQQLAALQPVPEIARRIEAFRQQRFRPHMIGVHLRRGDRVNGGRVDIPRNTSRAISLVHGLLKRRPDAGVLLCTDDGAVTPDGTITGWEGVRHAFHRAFGDRVVWTTPRSFDRREAAAIEDAVVDFFLLRATDAVVGSPGSSFSELAAFGRPVPLLWAGDDTWGYRLAEFGARITRLDRFIIWDGRRRFGRELAFPTLLNDWRGWLGRKIRRIFK